jgi:hypothetical protein
MQSDRKTNREHPHTDASFFKTGSLTCLCILHQIRGITLDKGNPTKDQIRTLEQVIFKLSSWTDSTTRLIQHHVKEVVGATYSAKVAMISLNIQQQRVRADQTQAGFAHSDKMV